MQLYYTHIFKYYNLIYSISIIYYFILIIVLPYQIRYELQTLTLNVFTLIKYNICT